MKTANATHVGPLTIYRWSKSPLLAIECYSYSTGTTLDIGIGRRSFVLVLPILSSPEWKSRIAAKRWYR